MDLLGLSKIVLVLAIELTLIATIVSSLMVRFLLG